ncbi:MAG: DUF2191 domain-containing protein [Gemmatimonadetes bacterium]|nr:DUF2191 domain-containing protein [Gemmatimonadota bacterium]
MRTTVDVDDGLLKRLRLEAHRRRIPFKHFLNRLLRQGLDARPAAPARSYRCPSFSMGRPVAGVDLDRALELAAELEDAEVARKLELRK